MTEQIIRVDIDEALKLAEAARAMLAALTACESIMHNGDTMDEWERALTNARAAIAQAEAAGIKVED
jgi:hypothetical protein